MVSGAADFQVMKVLPHLLDQAGRHMVSPSLFERDAYQDWLRSNPDQQSGIRYDIHWRARKPGEYVLKLELLGRVEQGRPNRKTVEAKVSSESSKSRWSALSLIGDPYQEFGAIVAWRVSLWQGDQLLAKHQSFLWE
jgi:hypothetical protein